MTDPNPAVARPDALDRRYPASRLAKDGASFELVRHEGARALLVETAEGRFPAGLEGLCTLPGGSRAVCGLSTANAAWMRAAFPHLAPCANPGKAVSIGLGDRLGRAAAGHLRALAGLPVFPVLAQQSMRELRLTGRTYEEVLAAATWGAFEVGWTEGYGADGDHLKTGEELDCALGCGFTMITLDCSDHIDKTLATLPEAEIRARYAVLPEAERADLEARYLAGGEPRLAALGVSMDRPGFERRVLTYRGAIAHSVDMYRTRIAASARPIDFEVSIDETATVTSPADHAFVALELLRRGVRPMSIAPRFCGEFQKGVDYRGDVARFRGEFAAHAAIARALGYRVSVHSGSDKFLVFPIVGAEAPEGYHLKTAGTHWLEALRVLSAREPALFREILRVAVASLPDARNFYHISGEAGNIAPEASMTDAGLPCLLDQDDARQVLHITYGHVLKHADPAGGTLGDRLHAALDRLEDAYAAGLVRHLRRHTDGLGLRLSSGLKTAAVDRLVVLRARAVLPDRILPEAALCIADGRIVRILEAPGDARLPDGFDGGDAAGVRTVDAAGATVVPGFVEVHTHGGGGHDFMDGTPEAFRGAARMHAAHGTTSLLPTTLASSTEALLRSLDTFSAAKRASDAAHAAGGASASAAGARILGLHLEGPYFSMAQKGAQDPAHIRNPDPAEYLRVLDRCPGILRWSAAPELPGAREFAQALRARGVRPSIAHSDAFMEDAIAAHEAGFVSTTHLYSGMSTVRRIDGYRRGGVVEAAYLLDGMYVEAIADGIHLPPPMLRMIWRIKGPGRVCLVTDSMRAAGMPDGKSLLGGLQGGRTVVVADGVAWLPDRSAFAGSVATGDRLLRTAHRDAGIPLVDVVRMLATTPADLLGRTDIGRIAEGARADFSILASDLAVAAVYIGGCRMERT